MVTGSGAKEWLWRRKRLIVMRSVIVKRSPCDRANIGHDRRRRTGFCPAAPRAYLAPGRSLLIMRLKLIAGFVILVVVAAALFWDTSLRPIAVTFG
jgi:hypothetical protein